MTSENKTRSFAKSKLVTGKAKQTSLFCFWEVGKTLCFHFCSVEVFFEITKKTKFKFSKWEDSFCQKNFITSWTKQKKARLTNFFLFAWGKKRVGKLNHKKRVSLKCCIFLERERLIEWKKKKAKTKLLHFGMIFILRVVQK